MSLYDKEIEILKRLEHRAMLKYIGDIPFTLVIDCLSEDDQKIYYDIIREMIK